MKKFKVFSISIACALVFCGCGASEKDNAVKHTVFIGSTEASSVLVSNGYVQNTEENSLLRAEDHLDFTSNNTLQGVDTTVKELSKTLSFNGEVYDLTYDSSSVYEPLSKDVAAFQKDKAYDIYTSKADGSGIEVCYNRDTGEVHSVSFEEKDIVADGSFTHEMAVQGADSLIKEFLGDDKAKKYEFEHVEDTVWDTKRFVSVMYVRMMYGYQTEQIVLVRFNNDGTLREITFGHLGFFADAKCQASALDHYEGILTKEMIENAEKELKKICPDEAYSNSTRIIGFDANGNCLLHMSYLFEDQKNLVKYYVNLQELPNDIEIPSAVDGSVTR